eukprot:tig00000350_g24340.t1
MSGPDAAAASREHVWDPLLRAKGYPYPRPASSFVFVDGEVYEVPDALARPSEEGARGEGVPVPRIRLDGRRAEGGGRRLAEVCSAEELDLARRTPVLGYGSNASPVQLERKFMGGGARCVIPVMRAYLRDFDSVYTMIVTSYGSIPAGLQVSPGTDVCVYITYLDEPQLERMHETEGGYRYSLLHGLRLQMALDGSVWPECYAYIGRGGHALWPGRASHEAHIALAEVEAWKRRYPALSQAEMLSLVRAVVSGELEDAMAVDGPVTPRGLARVVERLRAAAHLLDPFILAMLSKASARREAGARLAASLSALPFSYQRFSVVLDCGAIHNLRSVAPPQGAPA